MPKTSALTMATSVGIDVTVFRNALGRQNFPWHAPDTGWAVEVDSPEHKQMIAVLRDVLAADQAAKKAPAKARAKAPAAPKKAAARKAAKPKTV